MSKNIGYGKKVSGKRLQSIDTLRGLTMISMILYHFCWDLKYLNGFEMPWYGGMGSHIWQQSICWSFIIISGFCMHFARNPLRNGLLVFLCGVIVSCVTLLVTPGAAVMYGVLTFLGSSMLLVGGVVYVLKITGLIYSEKEFSAGRSDVARRGIDPFWGFFTCVILFAITKTINYGYLNFGIFMLDLPGFLYKGQAMTYLGFMEDGFYSSDYFSIMPWIFLFLAGYFLHGVLKNNNVFEKDIFHIELPFLSWFGRHSLIVYMVHQVILYVISMLIG